MVETFDEFDNGNQFVKFFPTNFSLLMFSYETCNQFVTILLIQISCMLYSSKFSPLKFCGVLYNYVDTS